MFAVLYLKYELVLLLHSSFRMTEDTSPYSSPVFSLSDTEAILTQNSPIIKVKVLHLVDIIEIVWPNLLYSRALNVFEVIRQNVLCSLMLLATT